MNGLGYDVAGNVTNDTITGAGSRLYDAENRMISASLGVNTGSSSYGYNADGKRVVRRIGGQETWYVYGISGELIAEYGAEAAATFPLKEYANGGQTMIVGDATNVRWTVADALGTPRILADKTGSLSGITRHDYLPFGEELFAGMGNGSIRTTGMGYANSGTPDGIRKKFTGYERDDETGLDYAQARYYSSKQGRFTSPDEFTGGPDELYDFADVASDNPLIYAELTEPQSLNKYQYCYNNPLAYVDPDGHKGIWEAIKQGAEYVSWVPGPIGQGASALRAGMALAEGDYKGALEYGVGAVAGGKGGTLLVKGISKLKLLDRAADTLKAVDKTEDVAKTAKNVIEPRPKFRKKTIENALKDAPDGADGVKICPTCGTKMTGEKVNGKRDFDVDHHTKTWAQRKKELAKKPNLNRKEVIDEYQKDVRAQCPRCNRGHKYEPKEPE